MSFVSDLTRRGPKRSSDWVWPTESRVEEGGEAGIVMPI